jgi:hypothetical protein
MFETKRKTSLTHVDVVVVVVAGLDPPVQISAPLTKIETISGRAVPAGNDNPKSIGTIEPELWTAL